MNEAMLRGSFTFYVGTSSLGWKGFGTYTDRTFASQAAASAAAQESETERLAAEVYWVVSAEDFIEYASHHPKQPSGCAWSACGSLAGKCSVRVCLSTPATKSRSGR
jgi:hypothetical protein